MSEAVTRGIRILVRSQFVPERSSSDEGVYLFAYQVTIHNEGEETVQLISRHWVITDGMGRVEEVKGPGVVGEQPRLEPGEAFQYTSACPLPTQIGAMEGTYQMLTDEGERFDCVIPIFTLAIPGTLN